MLVESLSSGSSGNALLVRSAGATLLIDCGLGPRALGHRLDERAVSLRTVNAVLLTHEHDDHVRGLDAVRAARCDLLGTPGTLAALGLDPGQAGTLAPFVDRRLGDLDVVAIPTAHDAAQPCGYSIADGSARITVLTDLGSVDAHQMEWLAVSDLVVMESNHDVRMLRGGPYPPHLKRRVQSRIGHLSNAECAAALVAAFTRHGRGRTIWLAHLSATNNRPDLAVRTVRAAFGERARLHEFVALPRRECGPVWDSTAPRPDGPNQLPLLGI